MSGKRKVRKYEFAEAKTLKKEEQRNDFTSRLIQKHIRSGMTVKYEGGHTYIGSELYGVMKANGMHIVDYCTEAAIFELNCTKNVKNL